MDSTTVKVTRLGAYGLVIREGSILLCRLSGRVGRFAGQWTLPGGGLDFGEDPADGMVREVFEETGLSVRQSGVAGVNSVSGELADRAYHSVRIIYHTEVLGGDLVSELDGTTDLCSWFTQQQTQDLALVDLVQIALPLVFS
jgi:8-oxo-dGTP diphosphatase